MAVGYFVYNENEVHVRRAGGFRIGDPNPKYVLHYGNWLYLTFITSRTQGLDRFQAEKELILCEKKLDWWSKRPGFELVLCLPKVLELKRQWEVTGVPDRWSR